MLYSEQELHKGTDLLYSEQDMLYSEPVLEKGTNLLDGGQEMLYSEHECCR
jgi:hypothetical protein